MSAERTALEGLFAEFYRDGGSIQRVAEQAGLDVARLPLGNTTPANAWHAVVTLAEQEQRMAALVDVVRKEHPRNIELEPTWEAYAATQSGEAALLPWVNGQAGDNVSDMHGSRADERRDARIDQMQRDMADMRVQIAGLVVQVAALTDMIRKQNEHETPSLTNVQFAAILAAFLALASLVFAAVYYGGNR